MFEKTKRAVRTVRAHSQFADNPRDRVSELFLNMLSSPTLPNVALGGLFSSTAAWAAGVTPLLVVYANLAAFILGLAIYAIGDDIRRALEQASQEYEMDEQDEAPYQD